MLQFLGSGTLTFFLILLTAAYLIQFRLLGMLSSPEGMVYLALVVTIQSLFALIYRLLLLRGTIKEQGMPPKRLKGSDMKGTLEHASSYLINRGYSTTTVLDASDSKILFFSKGIQRSRMIEAVLYLTLVFIFLSGLLNYAFGIKGFVEFGTTGGWTDLDSADMKKGVLARIMPTSIKLRLTEKTPAGQDRPASVIFEASRDGDKENIDRYWLQQGEYVGYGMLRIQFMGDYYLAFPTVFKERLDYRAVASKLKERDAGSGVYSGDLQLWHAGRKGTVEYEPAEKRFRVRVFQDEELEIDTDFIHPDEGRDRDFIVRVPTIGHIAVFHVSRYSYRTQVLAGTAILLVLLLMRLVFRPQRVWLRREGGRAVICTKRRRVRKALAQ